MALWGIVNVVLKGLSRVEVERAKLLKRHTTCSVLASLLLDLGARSAWPLSRVNTRYECYSIHLISAERPAMSDDLQRYVSDNALQVRVYSANLSKAWTGGSYALCT
jgi:hypothetical protein